MAWALPPADTPVVREWAARFLTAGLTPRPAVVVSRSVQVIRAAVLADDLLCWIPRPLFAADEAAGLVARLAIPALDWRRTFRVYRRRKSLVTPATALLLAAIRQQGAA
jgi:DNA-binding transcriptional LysR family regulator